MPLLRLMDRADLDVYYEADVLRSSQVVKDVVTREVFKAFYEGAASVGFEYDGKPIGGVLFDGDTAHIAVLPEYHGRWGRLLRPMLAWLYGMKQEIIVRIDDDNVKGLKFVEHCGWERLHELNGEVYYRMTPWGAGRVARIARAPQEAVAAA